MNFYDTKDWLALSKEISDNWTSIRDIESKTTHLFNEISILERQRDLSRNKSYEFECPPKSHIKILEKYTGQCDECWYYEYSKGGDLIKELQVAKAKEIIYYEGVIRDKKDSNKVLGDKQNKIRDKWIADQNKKEKANAD